jgi:hypothetical protein
VVSKGISRQSDILRAALTGPPFSNPAVKDTATASHEHWVFVLNVTVGRKLMNLWCRVRYRSEGSILPENTHVELPRVDFGRLRVFCYAWLVFRATFAPLEGYLSGFTAVLELDTLITVHFVGLGTSLRALI